MGGRQVMGRRLADRRRRRAGPRARARRADLARGGGGRRRDARGRRARERDRRSGARGAGSRPDGRGDERRRRQRRRASRGGRERGRRDAPALGRPGRAGPRAGVLLAGGGDRGAAHLPRARAAARHARPARGVPPHGRRAVHTRLRAGRDAEPLRPLQRQLPLRRAARVRRSRGRRHGSRPATTRSSSSARGAAAIARAVDAHKDQSYMLATVDPSALGRLWFPLGGQTKEETRAQAAAAGLGSRRQRREPGGVLPRRRRLPLVPRAARARPVHRARARREWAPAREPRGLLAVHARPAPRARHRRRASRSTRSPPTPGRTPSSSARERRSPGRGSRCAAASTARRPGRGEAPLPLARGRGDRHARPPAASSCASTSPRSASRPGRPPSSTRTTPSSAPAWSRPRPPTKVAAMLRIDVRGRCALPARILSARRRSRARLGAAPARDDLQAQLRVHPRHPDRAAAGDPQGRGSRSTG